MRGFSQHVTSHTTECDARARHPFRPDLILFMVGGAIMKTETQSTIGVLTSELEFLDKGRYAQTPSWKPVCIFEDSPSCVNFRLSHKPHPCEECSLIQFVPPERRGETIPCRHIPLNASGETLDALYRYGDQKEVEAKVRNWLQSTIQELENESARNVSGGEMIIRNSR
jgi:hypothetical protein